MKKNTPPFPSSHGSVNISLVLPTSPHLSSWESRLHRRWYRHGSWSLVVGGGAARASQARAPQARWWPGRPATCQPDGVHRRGDELLGNGGHAVHGWEEREVGASPVRRAGNHYGAELLHRHRQKYFIKNKLYFQRLFLPAKLKLFLTVFLCCHWYFRPLKLLLPIFVSHCYVAAEISLATEINIHLFSAAREQAAKNYMNLFSVVWSPAPKIIVFQGVPTTPFLNFSHFSIHKFTHIYNTVINTFSQLYDPGHEPQTQLFKSHIHKHIKIIHKHIKYHIHTHQQVSRDNIHRYTRPYIDNV
jgi:hypothetical protein